jgi:hypothetical protein
MIIRSLVLFIHVVGVLVLFIGIAFEWLSLESLRRSTTSEHASSWVRLYGVVPRMYGFAFALLLLSGIYLARGVGFEFPWVRLGPWSRPHFRVEPNREALPLDNRKEGVYALL